MSFHSRRDNSLTLIRHRGHNRNNNFYRRNSLRHKPIRSVRCHIIRRRNRDVLRICCICRRSFLLRGDTRPNSWMRYIEIPPGRRRFHIYRHRKLRTGHNRPRCRSLRYCIEIWICRRSLYNTTSRIPASARLRNSHTVPNQGYRERRSRKSHRSCQHRRRQNRNYCRRYYKIGCCFASPAETRS